MTIKRNILNDWVEEGLISAEQRLALADDLKTRNDKAVRRSIVLILGCIGAACLGFSAFLFISFNWELLSPLYKGIIALALPLTAIWASLVFVETLPLLCRALRLLAVLLVGGSIAMLGQAYSIDGTVTGLMVIWGLIGLVLALVLWTEIGALVALYLLAAGWLWEFSYGFDETLSRALVAPLVCLGAYFLSYPWAILSERFKAFSPEGVPCSGAFVRWGALTIGWISILTTTAVFRHSSEGSETLGLSMAAVFLLILGALVYYGNLRSNSYLRNGSLLFLFLLLFGVYCDLFWGYLETGWLFLTTGAVLIAMTVAFERTVKALNAASATPTTPATKAGDKT